MGAHHSISFAVGLLALAVPALAERPSEANEVEGDLVHSAQVEVQAQDKAAERVNRRCRVRARSAQSSSRRTFSATQILDLDFRVKLLGVSGDHVLRVDLKTPKGHHYQTLTVPFSADASSAEAHRLLEGFPRPLEVQVTKMGRVEGRAVPRVDARLPVAGTPIVHSALYGRWTATAYLDDEIKACGRRRFIVTP